MGLDLVCGFSDISWNGNFRLLVLSGVILLEKNKESA